MSHDSEPRAHFLIPRLANQCVIVGCKCHKCRIGSITDSQHVTAALHTQITIVLVSFRLVFYLFVYPSGLSHMKNANHASADSQTKLCGLKNLLV